MACAQLTICPLGSGSRGNCLYVGSPAGAVLIDVGFSARETRRRLKVAGLDETSILGLLITHEHGDHIGGLGALSRALKVPVWLTRGTYHAVGKPELPEVRHFLAGDSFCVGPLTIETVPLPHDAADPVAFVVSWEGRRVGNVTDLGHPTSLVIDRFRGCDFLVLEANHDVGMLLDGPYPWPVKQRIRGRSGHLSNEQSGELLEAVLHPGLQGLVLAHLSEVNNHPELALDLIRGVLAAQGFEQLPLWAAELHHPLCGLSV